LKKLDENADKPEEICTGDQVNHHSQLWHCSQSESQIKSESEFGFQIVFLILQMDQN
jgi:hypothetical protein